jgi:biofilm PGA synthesis N-glycosyltransferase PgaC
VLTLPVYVVVTPARNEGQFIESTIQSMLAQTQRPLKWVIVSDGSTDDTEAIVKKYEEQHDWIELVVNAPRTKRDFAGKVQAFNAGWLKVECLSYDVIVAMDADITFNGDYFSFLLEKMALDSNLGVVGTPFVETSGERYDYRFASISHVSGACQMFRRECFDAIGGYGPSKGGAIDSIAVITARMKGWRTRTFPERVCIHHRKMGTAQRGEITAKFKFGAKDYTVGNYPAWELFRCLYQMSRQPYVMGGLALGVGYLWACLQHKDRPVSPDLIKFCRKEQSRRLAAFVRSALLPGRAHRLTAANIQAQGTQAKPRP